jgi:hypothetical protein
VLIPENAKAVIIAELYENESDSMTDYYGYRTQRTVILGFSTHIRICFRQCAGMLQTSIKQRI